MAEDKNEQYRKIIASLQQEKQDSLEMSSELLKDDMRESLSELSVIDNHPADIGTEVYERERDAAERERLKGKIKAINVALERWQKGEYGVCEHCDRKIPMERLEVLPYTTVCLDCSRAEEIEAQHTFYREPVESEIFEQPFARNFGKFEDPAAFDKEDSWQAVARHGTSETLQDLGTNENLSDPDSFYKESY
ncbi:MAG: TraR/DksA C4-type zinc finger protein [Desulfitobacteriaceae bacterium]|nr:TraR/DksA C4-type zinc finger protein [Desulfitobacteriaceae bacterium]MDD4346392.1 TraR/DksA C4-type zinc finger protein [Desulfitobacteriaceae bacterium]MDD4401664.1 TraR/DksA C4-type zinc finger protein [Desulfitobacteriaceae bacterium]